MKNQSELYTMLEQLYAVDKLQGYTNQEINYLKQLFGGLPQVLEDYYRTAGRTESLHHVQDSWILPEHFKKCDWLHKSDYMILLNENQGICCAGIKRKDLSLPDPPVYTTNNNENWVLCSPCLSEFLASALAYEATFSFKYCPEEFYWVTKEELDFIKLHLKKYPFELKNWLEMEITFYSNTPNNLVAIMDCDGEFQMLYGASSKIAYDELLTVIGGIGEPI